MGEISKLENNNQTIVSNYNYNLGFTELEESIKLLEEKLNNLKKGDYLSYRVLSNQKTQLEKMRIKYENLKRGGITNKAKKELSSMFKEIKTRVDKGDKIGKIRDKGLSKIKEKQKQEKRYRKFIERNIDFQDIRESGIDGETPAIKEFYDLFMIEYINVLDKNKNLNGENINEKQILNILDKVIIQLINKNINLNYNKIIITLGEKKLAIDLNKLKTKVLEKIKLEQTKIIEDIIHGSNDIDEVSEIIKILGGNKSQDKKALIIQDIINKLNKIGISLDLDVIILLANKKIEDIKKRIEIASHIKNDFLLSKYINTQEIQTRKDVNNYKFLKEMMIDYYDGIISIENVGDILTRGYYYAFKRETESKRGKQGINNLKKYKKRWENIFLEELGSEFKDSDIAKDLAFLPWVESNCFPKARSKNKAQGRFQILLGTANSIDGNPKTKEYTIKDLQNPIISAKISAIHLKQIIKKIKKENPGVDFSDKKLLEIAVTKYNGNWTSRLKSNIKQQNNNDNIKLIYLVFEKLDSILVDINNLLLNEIIKKLKDIHNDFFKDHKNSKNGETHFGILDKINAGKTVNKRDISIWIRNYNNIILKQQLMYPYQLEAIKQLYNE